jgi:hypothetical protein
MPPDPVQKNCEIKKCPLCKEDMWVSEKKRKLIKENPDWFMVCLVCFVKTENLKKGLGFYPDTDIIDIEKVEDLNGFGKKFTFKRR